MLAGRYRGNDAVVGADLSNEPQGAATWGDDNPATDWRLAAERAGNAILDVNPDWLIIVEGIQHIGGGTDLGGGELHPSAPGPGPVFPPRRPGDLSPAYWAGGGRPALGPAARLPPPH